MKDLTKEQMDVLRTKLVEYRENFAQNRNISGTREKAMIVISQVFGEKSTEFQRFTNIGAYSWENGYTSDDAQTFVDFINGVLDTFDIFSA